jgi:NitT/TauT family transport system substrate-binding protein
MKVVPQENAQTLEQFKSGQISAAWVPEPWATRLVQQAGGKVFLDERSLWPDGRFVTTHIIVRTKFLNERPDVVKNLIAGHIEATDWLNANPAEGQSVVNGGIAKLTGQAMPVAIIAAAWEKLNFVVDPIASSLRKSATDAQSAGLLDSKAKIDGIYDLRLINELLTSAGKPTVKE